MSSLDLKSLNTEQLKIYKLYITLLKGKKGNGKVLQKDLDRASCPRQKVRKHFVKLQNLEELVLKEHPELFPKGHIVGSGVDTSGAEEKKWQVHDTYVAILRDKNRGGAPSLLELKEAGVTRHQLRERWDNLLKLEKHVLTTQPNLFPDGYKLGESKKIFDKREGLSYYLKLKNELGRIPSRKELVHMEDGPSASWFSKWFGSVAEMESAARKEFPDQFTDYSIKQLTTKTRIKQLRQDVKDYDRFIITSAVTGCDVDENFYKSLKKLAKKKNAKILVIVCSDPAKNKDKENKLGHVDKTLAENETIIIEDTALNENLHISTIKLTAKQINPLTGLDRMGKKEGSFIYASPKFFLKYVAVRNNKNKLPHCIMTTGAITKADYNSDMYMSQRTANLAEFDHKLGAIYVEIENKKQYHFRQVQCLNDEGEIYLDAIKYSPSSTKTERPEAFIMGDLHVGATCPKTRQAWIDIIKKFKPKKIVLHDALNGHSINHWIEKDIIAKALQVKAGLDCLDKELRLFGEELKFWAGLVEEVIMVPSNHNDWLERWLRKAGYAKDPKNHYTGVSIAKYWMDKIQAGIKCSPIEPALAEYCKMDIPNVQWLGRNDDYYIGDVQINCHGDVGVNGSRGSLISMESAYGSSASGHSHTAGIIRDAWAVGTSTHLQEAYNNGPGTWTNTSMLIYKDGSRCLYNAIDGKWTDGRNQ
jgi:hypothetical protein